MAAVWRAGSMGRCLVQHFPDCWPDGQLIAGPDGKLQAALHSYAESLASLRPLLPRPFKQFRNYFRLAGFDRPGAQP